MTPHTANNCRGLFHHRRLETEVFLWDVLNQLSQNQQGLKSLVSVADNLNQAVSVECFFVIGLFFNLLKARTEPKCRKSLTKSFLPESKALSRTAVEKIFHGVVSCIVCV